MSDNLIPGLNPGLKGDAVAVAAEKGDVWALLDAATSRSGVPASFDNAIWWYGYWPDMFKGTMLADSDAVALGESADLFHLGLGGVKYLSETDQGVVAFKWSAASPTVARKMGALAFYKQMATVSVWMPGQSERTLLVGRQSRLMRWRFADKASRVNGIGGTEERLCQSYQNASALALFSRYSWWVRIKIGDGIGLRFPCQPEEAKQLFKLRDLPDGKKRREALRNWVRGYKRTAGEVAVREHLRGAINFSFDGVECEVLPSQFDREREIARIGQVSK